VTNGSGDTTPDTIRVSDVDRDAVVDRLREHTAAGRLTLQEFEARAAEVMQSRTVADLQRTLRDLPSPMPVLATEKAVRRQLRRRRAFVHIRNFAGINAICIAIWALSGGGYFWPEWVIFGTSIPMIGYIASNAPTDEEKKEQAAKQQELEQAEEASGGGAATGSRILATVLYTDVVDSTRRVAEMGDERWARVLDQYEEVVNRSIERAGGRLVKVLGDGALARFATPADAIRCAIAISDASHALGFEVRAGVHTGEIEVRGDDVTGIAVHLGQRVCAAADPGEVWVTRTVVDLVAGAGLHFDDRGEHELRGVPGKWQLSAASL